MNAFVALGSNIPPREALVLRALELLAKGPNCIEDASSSSKIIMPHPF